MTLEIDTLPDGTLVLRHPDPLAAYPRVLTERLLTGAVAHPDRVLLAERAGNTWQRVSWADTLAAVLSIGQALLDRGLSADRPLLLLSPGSVDHALLALAATHVGIPYCPVSPMLGQTGGDRLAQVLDLMTPGLVWVQDSAALPEVTQACVARGVPVICSAAGDVRQLRQTAAGPAVAAAHAAIRPDDIRSFIFTSGTSGMPKAVINTHRMTCANQQMFVQSFPTFAAVPPEFLSWLPWHHTSGANAILGSVIYGGGTLWIDGGRPVAGRGMATTLANLQDIAPTAYFSAPSGFRLLAQALRDDPGLRRRFFSRLAFFFYSGASLPPAVAAEMDAVARLELGRAVPFFACYGATETAPFALALNWTDTTPGLVGLPMPGVTLKLAPVDGLREVRASGPSVTPGYWRNPAATAAAFDAEGFYRYGDALALPASGNPQDGLLFDGRLGENFKLATGTWVNVAGLREQLLLAAGAILSDAVICGEGQDQVGALLFVDPQADPARAHAALRAALQALADRATGSSTCVARALVMAQPPDPAQGEVTDKGSVSSRAILRNRASDVARLFAPAPDDAVILLSPAASRIGLDRAG